MKNLSINPDVLVCHAEKWRYENNKIKIVQYGPEINATYKNLLINEIACRYRQQSCQFSFRKIGYFSERSDIISAEDYDLWIRIAKSNHKFLFLNSTY